jgi:hypothetical protein
MSRYQILQSIKSAIEGLQVTVRDEPRTIRTTDTLINPTDEKEFPIFTITPSIETDTFGLYGYAPINCTMKVDIFGFTDGGSMSEVEDLRKSRLAKAAEDIVQAVKKKLTDPLWLDEINCAFSITQIGPIIVEHAELEDWYAYISMPITVQYLDDVQNENPDRSLIYYIDPVRGNDSNDGTFSALAWKTLHNALNLANDQKIMYLYNGRWYLYRRNDMTLVEGDLIISIVDSVPSIF